jgi:hypothetical protein
MAIEIFIEPELEDLELTENSTEWFKICSELGLDTQLNYANKSEEKKAPPYMFIDPKTSRIISTLCPRQVIYQNYKASTIPLDVLKEIQKAEKNGWYSRICICYDDQSPDPFVIGFTHSEHSWNCNLHLIARWGGELLPFEILEQKAIQRMQDAAKKALKELQFKVNSALEDIDFFNKCLLSGEKVPEFNFSCREISKW